MAFGKRAAVGAVLAFFAAGTAQAAAFDFAFTTPSITDQSSYTFTASGGGLSVDVTGSYYNAPGAAGSPFSGYGSIDVENNIYGLISCNPSEEVTYYNYTYCPIPEHAIDSIDGYEAMIFDFGSNVVDLTSVVLGWISDGGYYDLFVGSSLADATYVGNTYDGPVLPQTGSVFIIGTSAINTGECDQQQIYSYYLTCYCDETLNPAIKIAGMSVDTHTPEVPLPATGLILLGGLGGLGALKRRRKG